MALEKIGLGGILTFAETKAVAAMGRASKAFGGLRKGSENASKSIESFSRASRNAGLAMTPFAIAAGFAVKKAAEFETAVAEVTTIADEAQFPIMAIEKATLDLAVQYGTAPVEQVKSLYQAISAGATNAKDATELLTASNELAIGGLTETFVAMDVLTTATNAYAAANLIASDAADAIFTAVKAGKTTVDELGRSLGAVIPTASQVGVSFDELNAAIAAITVQGIASAEAATGLNMALINILKPSKLARETAEDLGLEFNVAALEARGLATFLQAVVFAAEGDTEVLTKLFGSVTGVKAIMALTTNEAAKFNEVLGMMEEKAGAARGAFEKMSKTLGFQMKRVSALKDVGFIALGQAISTLLDQFIAPFAGGLENVVMILRAASDGLRGASVDFSKLDRRSAAFVQGIIEGGRAIRVSLEVVKSILSGIGKIFEGAFGPRVVEFIGTATTVIFALLAVLGPLLLAVSGVGFAITTILIPGFIAATAAAKVLFWPLLKVFGLIAGLPVIVIAAVAAIAVLVGGLFLLKKENESLGTTIKRVTNDIVLVYREMVDDIVQFLITAAESWANAMLEPLRSFAAGIGIMLQAIGVEVPAGVAALQAMKVEIPRPKIPPTERKFVPTEKLVQYKGPELALAELTAGVMESVGEMTKDIKGAAQDTKTAAQSAEAAAKKKPCAKVEIDKREVGRAVAKHQDEVKTRSGFKATPYQRRQIVENGAI